MFLAASGESHNGSRDISRIIMHILCILVAFAAVATLVSPASAKPPFSAITVDARSGRILFAIDADGKRHPASLTKVMTLYLLFEDLRAGRIKLSSKLLTSRYASSRAPSKLGLKPGQTIRVDDAIKSLVTLSANDVATVIAENLGGSESAFASRMTKKARSLGMNRTVFVNASGLPDPRQITTARDMATLGLRIQRDFPEYYPYFRIQSFKYGRRVIRSHNRLLGRFDGTDGIKTGYIRASGFNLITSARRGGKRVVGAVMGGSSGRARDQYMMAMLERAFPKCVNGTGIALAAGKTTAIALVKEKTEIPAAKPAPLSLAEEEEVNIKPKSAPRQKPVRIASVKSSEPVEDINEDIQEQAGTTFATVSVNEEPSETTVPSPSKETNASTLPDSLPFAVKAEGDANLLAAIPNADTWHIQVGAYPSKEDAQAKLMKARKAGIKILDGKMAFTVQVQKGPETVYRARFSGFSAETAKTACEQLTQKGISCLTLAPQT